MIERTHYCILCEAPLCLRTNRATGERYFGCSRWPACRSTQAAPPRSDLDALQARITALEQQLVAALRAAARHGSASATLPERDLKKLIALAHPDKWQGKPATELAHRMTQALLEMRSQRRQLV